MSRTQTPVLVRKRKGQRNGEFSSNLMLNSATLESSPQLRRSLSIRSLRDANKPINFHKYGSRSNENNDFWANPKEAPDATREEMESVSSGLKSIVVGTAKWLFNGVRESVDRFTKRSKEEVAEPLEEKDDDSKKRKVVEKESPLKQSLANEKVPDLDANRVDFDFSESPIEWEFKKADEDSEDYGTKFINRNKHSHHVNPTASYLRSIFKNDFRSPSPRDSTPPTPGSSNNDGRLLEDIKKLTSDLSNNFRRAVPSNEDITITKVQHTTPTRYELKFTLPEVISEETVFYQSLLRERQLTKEQAHKEKLEALAEKKTALPAISKEEEEELKNIWKSKGSDRQKIITAFNIDVTVADFKTLADRRWLNDVIIEVFLKTLDSDKVHCFNSYMFTTLEGKGYAGVKKWMKRAKKDITKLEKIVCPINVHGSHWVLGVIDLKKKKIEYFDSLATSVNSFSKRALSLLSEYVEGEAEKQGHPALGKGFELTHVTDCPQQRNGFDCGVFTLLNASLRVKDKDLDYDSTYPTQFRKLIALKVLRLSNKKK